MHSSSRGPSRVVGEAEQRIAPLLLSFMSESRRLSNARDEARAARAAFVSDAQRLLAEIAPRDLKEAARRCAVSAERQ
jgi:hypothetical protein